MYATGAAYDGYAVIAHHYIILMVYCMQYITASAHQHYGITMMLREKISSVMM